MRNPNATYHEIDQEWTQPSTGQVYHRTIIISIYHDLAYGADLDGNRGVERTEWEEEAVNPWKGPHGECLDLEAMSESDLEAYEASEVMDIEKAVKNFLAGL